MKHALALLVLTGLLVTACDKPAIDNLPKEQAILPEVGAANDKSMELETGESGDEGIQSDPDTLNIDKNIITLPPVADMPPDIVPEAPSPEKRVPNKPFTEPTTTEPSKVTPTN